jgi:hypothetical protein
MAITKTDGFVLDGSRYQLDTALPKDFAQLDTSEDASYYGNWASAKRLVLVSYCEGDCTTTKCETIEEFKQQIESFQAFSNSGGRKFKGIDPGWSPTEDLIKSWRDCGLAHLLY